MKKGIKKHLYTGIYKCLDVTNKSYLIWNNSFYIVPFFYKLDNSWKLYIRRLYGKKNNKTCKFKCKQF